MGDARLARIKRPDVLGALGFALLGFAYCFVTPPFRGPDERNHFFRSYQISELRLTGHRLPDGFSGDHLPAALSQLAEVLGNHQDNRVTEAQLAAARAVELYPASRVPTEFSNTVLYSPVVYAPAAVGIGVGRAIGARPLHLLYLGRAANIIAGCLLIALVIRRLGYARWPVLLAAALPMALSQGSLVTADAMTFAIVLLWLAYVVDLAVAPTQPIPRTTAATILGIALLLSQLRPPYPMLAVLILLIPASRLAAPRWKAAVVYAAVLLAAGAPAVAWNASARPLFVAEPGYDMRARVADLKDRPHVFVRAAKRDFVRRGGERWSQVVGRFGWLNIPLPAGFTTAYAAALALSCYVGGLHLPRPRWWQRALLLAAGLVGIVTVQLLLFITYDVGWVQGRYLVPFIAVLAFACGGFTFGSARVRKLALGTCLAVALATHVAALFAIARAGAT